MKKFQWIRIRNKKKEFELSHFSGECDQKNQTANPEYHLKKNCFQISKLLPCVYGVASNDAAAEGTPIPDPAYGYGTAALCLISA